MPNTKPGPRITKKTPLLPFLTCNLVPYSLPFSSIFSVTVGHVSVVVFIVFFKCSAVHGMLNIETQSIPAKRYYFYLSTHSHQLHYFCQCCSHSLSSREEYLELI